MARIENWDDVLVYLTQEIPSRLRRIDNLSRFADEIGISREYLSGWKRERRPEKSIVNFLELMWKLDLLNIPVPDVERPSEERSATAQLASLLDDALELCVELCDGTNGSLVRLEGNYLFIAAYFGRTERERNLWKQPYESGLQTDKIPPEILEDNRGVAKFDFILKKDGPGLTPRCVRENMLRGLDDPRCIRVGDAPSDPDYVPLFNIRSELLAPIILPDGKVWGAIVIDGTRANQFEEHHQPLLANMGKAMGAVVDRLESQRQQELDKWYKEFETQLDALCYTTPEAQQDIGKLVTETVNKLLNLKHSSLWIREPQERYKGRAYLLAMSPVREFSKIPSGRVKEWACRGFQVITDRNIHDPQCYYEEGDEHRTSTVLKGKEDKLSGEYWTHDSYSAQDRYYAENAIGLWNDEDPIDREIEAEKSGYRRREPFFAFGVWGTDLVKPIGVLRGLDKTDVDPKASLSFRIFLELELALLRKLVDRAGKALDKALIERRGQLLPASHLRTV